MQNTLQLFLMVMLFICIYGCSNLPSMENTNSTYEERSSTYSGKDCCISVDKTKQNEINGAYTFSMDENQFKLKVGDTLSNYIIFKIPDTPDEQYYKIISYHLEDKSLKNGKYAYIPTVKILDSDYRVTRESNPQKLYDRVWSIWSNAHFYLYLKINKTINPSEKYILIHSNQDHFGGTYTLHKQQYNQINTYVAGGQPVVYSDSIKPDDVSVTISPSGVLQIELLGLLNRPLHEDRDIHF